MTQGRRRKTAEQTLVRSLASVLPGQIFRQLALEFRKIARDDRHVEAPEDRLFGLAVEQEAERRFDQPFRVLRAGGKARTSLARDRDLMPCLAPLAPNDHQPGGVSGSGAPPLNHVCRSLQRCNRPPRARPTIALLQGAT